MKDFDKHIRNAVAKEDREIPKIVSDRIEDTLRNLPANNIAVKPKVIKKYICVIPAAAAFIVLVLLPNISVTYAKALASIPVIGDIVKVVTIRNYFYLDEGYEMDIDVPQIENENDMAADYINRDVDEITNALVEEFYRNIEMQEGKGYGYVNVEYEVVANKREWFTLKLNVSEIVASSNNYFVFYHIDMRTGEIVQLGDLFEDESYREVLTSEIISQMKKRMEDNPDERYWVDDAQIGDSFATVRDDHNFYWKENGDLVIVFDKYEVGPGSVGTPEFSISKEKLKNILKEQYKDVSFTE